MYEVVATWSSYELFGGTVHYAFRSSKPNLDWDSYPKIGVERGVAETYSAAETPEGIVYTKTHHRMDDGLWMVEEYGYLYRLEITGRLNGSDENVTYIVLSNRKDVTWDGAWKASGLSSLSTYYFHPADAVVVGYKYF